MDAYNRNNFIGMIVGTITLSAATAYLSYLLVGALSPAIVKSVVWLMNHREIHTIMVLAKHLGFNAVLKYLTGTPLYNLIKDLPVEEWLKMFSVAEYYNYGLPLAYGLAVLLGVIIGGVTLSQVLQGMEVIYLPSYKISESFYSGNTADHNAWETNYVNLQNEISSLSPVVQGIIMVPPKLDKINNIKHNFPWETISEYY